MSMYMHLVILQFDCHLKDVTCNGKYASWMCALSINHCYTYSSKIIVTNHKYILIQCHCRCQCHSPGRYINRSYV